MNIYQRLNAARQEFHSLKLEKTGHNKFAGYKYFELADFLVPALRIFDKHGLCAVVSFEKDTASMIIFNAETPEECIAITSPLGSAQLKGCHEIQNIGACMTYSTRYLWTAALQIVEHDALDATTGKDAKGDQSKIIAPARLAAEEAASLLTDAEKESIYRDLDDVLALAEGGKTTPLIDWYYKLPSNEHKMVAWNEVPSGLRRLLKENQPKEK
jgi:hypothetical protein